MNPAHRREIQVAAAVVLLVSAYVAARWDSLNSLIPQVHEGRDPDVLAYLRHHWPYTAILVFAVPMLAVTIHAIRWPDCLRRSQHANPSEAIHPDHHCAPTEADARRRLDGSMAKLMLLIFVLGSATAAVLDGRPVTSLASALSEQPSPGSDILGLYLQSLGLGENGLLLMAPNGLYFRCRLGCSAPYKIESGHYTYWPPTLTFTRTRLDHAKAIHHNYSAVTKHIDGALSIVLTGDAIPYMPQANERILLFRTRAELEKLLAKGDGTGILLLASGTLHSRQNRQAATPAPPPLTPNRP